MSLFERFRKNQIPEQSNPNAAESLPLSIRTTPTPETYIEDVRNLYPGVTRVLIYPDTPDGREWLENRSQQILNNGQLGIQGDG